MRTNNTVTPGFFVVLAAALAFLLIDLAAASDPPLPATAPAANADKPPADAEKPPAPTTQPALEAEQPPVPAAPAPTTQPGEDDPWITTASGLKYTDIVEGQWPPPQPLDLVRVNYIGTLEDGTMFHASSETERPAQFRLGRQTSLPPGLAEGISTMKVGGKRAMLIPPHLGYGLRGAPPKIPANATLRYEIELLEIRPAPTLTETKPEDEVTTDSGLRYVDIKVGDGASPADDSMLRLRFASWGPDGSLLRSSDEYMDPITVLVSTIPQPAIKEGLIDMKAGGRRKLLIADPQPPTTQPSAKPPLVRMIIEIELLEVNEAPRPTEVPEDQYVTTPSGLKYYDLKAGQGEFPKENSRIRINFTGWLEDGTIFDSTIVRGQPYELPLMGWFKGLAEGLLTMKVGGKRKLVIPPELGYGERVRQGVPPNSTIIMEVELLKLVPPSEAGP